MKKSSVIFLQAVTVLAGAGVLTALLWEPHLEGRNVNSTVFQIYFTDPFLAYVYLGSIPFFVGLYSAWKILGYAREDSIFSAGALKAIGTIKYCALITAGAIVGADVFLAIAARHNGEDSAGAVALGMIATFLSLVVAAGAVVFEGIIKKGKNKTA